MNTYGLGRLTKEPELKYSTSGTAYLTNSIACDRKDKDKTTDFFNIKAFGKTAEAMNKYLHKGSKILVEGKLQNDTYEGKDGVKKTSTAIFVTSWEFAESKGEKTESKPNNDFLNVAADIEEQLPFS